MPCTTHARSRSSRCSPVGTCWRARCAQFLFKRTPKKKTRKRVEEFARWHTRRNRVICFPLQQTTTTTETPTTKKACKHKHTNAEEEEEEEHRSRRRAGEGNRVVFHTIFGASEDDGELGVKADSSDVVGVAIQGLYA